MSRKRGPKLPKKLQMRAASVMKPEPVTAEDFWELGTEEEESGDRWLASDLAKALRFYHRAFERYQGALSIDEGNVDAQYNLARLLLHVYNSFIRQEGIELHKLESVEAAKEVIQPLHSIISVHEAAILKSHMSVSWELLYNCAMAYSEFVEELADDEASNWSQIVAMAIKARDIYTRVLVLQRTELAKLVKGLDALSEDSLSSTPEPKDYKTQETVIPETIVETVVQCYKLVASICEVTLDENKIRDANMIFTNFVKGLDTLSGEINLHFGPGSNADEVLRLKEALLEKLRLQRLEMLCAQATRFAEISSLWEQEAPTLAETPERYMVESDCIQALIDKHDTVHDQAVWWNELTAMNKSLRKASDMLTAELTRVRGKDNYSQVLSQLCSVIIARADIDRQRSRLETPEAGSARETLLKNCTQLLKNAGNYASMSGGLREGITDRLVREKRKREAIVRLCALENKPLASINLSEHDFKVEMAEMALLGIY